MHTLDLSSITRLLHISPAPFQFPRQSLHGHRRRHYRSTVFSSNQPVDSLSPQDTASKHQQNISSPPLPLSSSTRTPLVDAIVQRGLSTHEAPFHVPGHKRGSTVPPSLKPILGPAMQYDLTELDGLDYLSYPEGPILEAQQLAAEAWGAEKTWLSVNGTTVGIHAAIMATCSTSSTSSATNTLILARNAHQSAFNAAALAGCQVEYAMPSTACGLAHHVSPEALEDAFQRAKTRGLHPKAAFIVSPTYFGVVSDIEALVKVCHQHGAVLIVDEAHGAHLHFLPALEESVDSGTTTSTTTIKSKAALDLGADIVIQSTHKLLGALTQGAMLHLKTTSENFPSASSSTISLLADLPARISRALSILQTSSPSYLIMASLDAARAQVQDPETMLIPHAAAAVISSWLLKNNLKELEKKKRNIELSLLTADHLVGFDGEVCMDPWRFTVLLESVAQNKNSNTDSDNECTSVRFTGWDAAAALERECGVVAELATKNAVVFAVGIGTTMQHAEALIKGLEWLETSWMPDTKIYDLKDTSVNINDDILKVNILPEVVLTPREALFAAAEVVPWAAAVGRISAELLCPYPPGIPAVCPGERIDREVLDMVRDVVKKGGKVVGAADGSLKTLRVLVEEI